MSMEEVEKWDRAKALVKKEELITHTSPRSGRWITYVHPTLFEFGDAFRQDYRVLLFSPHSITVTE